MNLRRACAASLMIVLGSWICCCSRAQPVHEANAPALEALLARCRTAVSAHPKDARARAELALAFEANGRWVEAAEHYGAARDLGPDEPMWVAHAAICETEAGELARARRTLEAGAARFPACAPIVQRLALAELEDGDFARAKDDFSALAKLEGSAVAGWTGVAEAELALGNASVALEASERALGLDPGYRLPRFLRARCLSDLGRTPEAAREFEAAGIAQRRMLGDAWSARAAEFAVGFEARFARAVEMLDGERVSEALAAFEALARERPDDVRTLGNLAMAQAAAKDFTAALVTCDRALAREPNSAPLHAARARVLLGAGRPVDALAAARRANEIDPNQFEVLALAHFACGEKEASKQVLIDALRRDPTNASLRKRLESLKGLGQ